MRTVCRRRDGHVTPIGQERGRGSDHGPAEAPHGAVVQEAAEFRVAVERVLAPQDGDRVLHFKVA